MTSNVEPPSPPQASSNALDAMILPWNAFPAVAKSSKNQRKLLALVGGAIALLVGLLVLKLLT